jgi:hypothetical protein
MKADAILRRKNANMTPAGWRPQPDIVTGNVCVEKGLQTERALVISKYNCFAFPVKSSLFYDTTD